MDPNYCKLFVDTEVSHSELLSMVGIISHGPVGTAFIDTVWGSIDIRKNDEAGVYKDHPNDRFLGFSYLFDIELRNENRITEIQRLRDLILALRSHGFEVVAACEFEHEL